MPPFLQLNMASHVIYRYTYVRCTALLLVIQVGVGYGWGWGMRGGWGALAACIQHQAGVTRSGTREGRDGGVCGRWDGEKEGPGKNPAVAVCDLWSEMQLMYDQ